KKLDKEKNAAKIKKGLEKAEQYANDLINNTANWGRIPGGSDIMATFSQSERTWNMFRNMHNLRVDIMKCKKCGLCVRLCPIENIKMTEYPAIGGDCYLCMRCVSFCPSNAITRKNGKGNDYKALKASDMLKL
ncbi:MAG: 4Fe-4S binding protein, partial [Thermoplasmata archaeon]|nr:4Fe-4S binding protein [Thermoplasmata archaeon]